MLVNIGIILRTFLKSSLYESPYIGREQLPLGVPIQALLQTLHFLLFPFKKKI